MSETNTDSHVVDPAILAALAATHVRSHLMNAPDRIAHVRGLVTPRAVRVSDGQPRAFSSEPPLPIRSDALEASDRVYAQLLNWVRYWSAELGIEMPATATAAWATDGGPQGFRSTVTAPGAYALTWALTSWLLIHHDTIREQPEADEYIAQVDSMLFQIGARFPMDAPQPKAVLPRPCPVCGMPTMHIERHSEAVTDISIVCSYCRFEGDAKAMMKDRDVRSLLTDIRFEEAAPAAEWWTKKQAAREMRITPQTLNRYIQHDGLRTHTAEGNVYVNADQLRELWRAKHARVKRRHPKESEMMSS